jgi:hypothetical protein
MNVMKNYLPEDIVRYLICSETYLCHVYLEYEERLLNIGIDNKGKLI